MNVLLISQVKLEANYTLDNLHLNLILMSGRALRVSLLSEHRHGPNQANSIDGGLES